MKKILLFGLLILIFSCEKNKQGPLVSQFREKSDLHASKAIEVDSLYITFPKIYNLTDTSIVITSPTSGFSSQKYLVYIVSKRTGKIVRKLGAEGRGPNELQSINTVAINNDEVQCFDGTGYRLFHYNYINDSAWAQKISFNKKSLIKDYFLINNNKYLAYGDFGKQKYSIGDLTTGNEKYFIEQPYLPDISEDKQQDYIFARSSAYSGSLTNHPDDNKFLLTAIKSEYLQIIEIIGDSVKEVMHIDLSPPKGKIVSQFNTDVWVSYRGFSAYFMDAVSSTKFIYILYSGNPYNDVDDAKGKYIMVFDWKGNKVRLMELEKEAYAITVDQYDKELITLSINQETSNYELLFYPI